MDQLAILSRLNVSSDIIHSKLSGEDMLTILKKYDEIAHVAMHKEQAKLVADNAINYTILLTPQVFLTVMLMTKRTELVGFKDLNNLFNVSYANSNSNSTTAYKSMRKYLAQQVATLSGNEFITAENFGIDDVINAVRTLDVPENTDVDGTEYTGFEDMDLTVKDGAPDFSGLFDDMGDEPPVEEEPVSEKEEPEPEKEEEPAPVEDEEPSQEELDRKAKRKKIDENGYTGTINKQVEILVKFLMSLYESGFSGMATTGIMVTHEKGPEDAPLVKLLEQDGEYRVVTCKDGSWRMDSAIFLAIRSINPQVCDKLPLPQDERFIPDANTLINSRGVLRNLHLLFSKARIKYSDDGKKQVSIKRWIKEEKLKSKGESCDEWLKENNCGNRSSLTNIGLIREWYKWCIENIIYDALIDTVSNFDNIPSEEVGRVLRAVDANIKNVIVVLQRDNEVETDLRIGCSKTDVEIEALSNAIKSSIDIGSGSNIEVKAVQSQEEFETKCVIEYQIKFDKAKANSANMFAGDVLETMLQSGTRPSWSHALLGKKKDGTYLFWDEFMTSNEAYGRCYAIYAGSGAGKGILTSTLLANALCDCKQIFYTDGKPENGMFLGELAWREQKEAYVFDGKDKGKEPYPGYIEQYTSGVRKNGEVAEYAERLPKDLFVDSRIFDTEQQQVFLGLMRYLKSLYLCMKSIIARADGLNGIDKSEWQIWVFDEIKSMADIEIQIRLKFAKYLDNLGISDTGDGLTKIKSSKKIGQFLSGEKENEGVKYIYNWCEWLDNLLLWVKKATVIDLRKSDTNIIFIFQEASWLANVTSKDPQSNYKVTFLYKMIKNLSCLKIVGKNGLQNTCGVYGNAPAVKSDWGQYIDSHKGWWGISESPNLGSDNPKATLFRPYNLWGIPLKNGVRMERAPEGEETHYFAGYVDKLLGKFGMNAGDILQGAYNYANNTVKTLGWANSLKEFIYDCSNFADEQDDNSLRKLREEYENSEDNEQYQDSDENRTYDENELTNDNENDGDEDIIEGYGDKPETKEEVTLKLMTTKALMDKGYSPDVLNQYVAKILLNKLDANQFDYSDRNEQSTTGLKMACIMLSNLHYCGEAGANQGIGFISQKLMNKIKSGGDTDNKAKLALGLLNSYDAGSLQYDVMPSKEILMTFIEKYKQMEGNTIFRQAAGQDNPNEAFANMFGNNGQSDTSSMFNNVNIDIPPIDEMTVDDVVINEDGHIEVSEKAVPQEDVKFQSPFFKKDNNGKDVFTPRPFQSVFRMEEDGIISTEIPHYSPVEKMKKFFFESKNGTAYEFKKRWDHVLEQIEDKFRVKSMVTRMAFMGDCLFINGKTVDLSGILGGEYDIRIEDIVRIRDTLKRFKFVNELVVDQNMLKLLMAEYKVGDESVVKLLFEEFKRLQKFGIIPPGEGQPIVYTRQNLNVEAQKLKNQIAEEKARMKLERFAAEKNPRLHEKSPGYTKRVFDGTSKVFKGSVGLTKDLFKGVSNSVKDQNPKLIKAAAFSLAAVPVMAFGSIVGLFGLTTRGIGKLTGLFKRD